MRIGLTSVTTVIAVIGFTGAAMAQMGGGAIGGANDGRSLPGSTAATQNPANNSITPEQANLLRENIFKSRLLSKDDKAAGKTLAQVLAEDKAAAIALAKAMPLSCDVTDAMRIAEGTETVDGKTVQTETYEAACSNGLGYFLTSRDTAKPYGFTCFATDATAKADIAARRKPGVTCKLPANANLNLVAAKILATSGAACTVKDYRWVGLSDVDHIEVNEVACDNGQGYIMIVALPGATFPVHVETCNQSARRGLPCKLSDNGDIGPTLQSFRDTLAKNKIACDATDQTTRVIGQIVANKQHVVEFACPQQPKGLVAYIPQEGSTAPFEALDCPTAAKRGAVCALPGNKH